MLKRAPAALLLSALFLLQGCNLVLAFRRVGEEGLLSIQAVAAFPLLCVASVVSGAVAGHELIHRKTSMEVAMGRLLLASILYEHFHTEHLSGHHVRFATEEDPATARYGETYAQYLRRTLPAQWRSAWRLESARVNAQPFWRHRLLQGLAVELAFCAGAFLLGGFAALALFLLQAAVVQAVFSAVQYFQHWGLAHGAAAPHSWDAVDRVSFVNLLGLSRHADHHVHPSRGFEAVESSPDAPKLPYPYSVMVWLAIARNSRFQHLMTAELARCGLAPRRES